jgi:hypothetical protein
MREVVEREGGDGADPLVNDAGWIDAVRRTAAKIAHL